MWLPLIRYALITSGVMAPGIGHGPPSTITTGNRSYADGQQPSA
jgi:hypothetical protein